MQNLDTMYTDATCYESEMRYPTDPKLLWEGIEKSYETMCELGKRLGIHRPRTKFIDVQKANLAYKKQRKHSKSKSKDCRESIPNRIVSISKPYVRPIVRRRRRQTLSKRNSPGCISSSSASTR